MTCKYSILLLVGYLIYVQGDAFYTGQIFTGHQPRLGLRSSFDQPAPASPAPVSAGRQTRRPQQQPVAPVARQDQVPRAAAAMPSVPAAAAAANDLQRPVGGWDQQWNNNVQPNNNVRPNQQYGPTANDSPRVQGVDASGSGSGPSLPTVSTSPTRPPAQENYMEQFSSKLFQPIAARAQQKNMVYSPAMVHSQLAMLYIVSHGRTFDELKKAGIFSADFTKVSQDFLALLNLQKLQNAEIIVASKVFYNPALGQPNPQFPQYALTYFNTEIETFNPQDPRNSANDINAWVQDRTRNTIKKLITQSEIDDQTQAILLNAIYFKARWANEFSTRDTTPAKFRMGNGAAINVAMMYNDDVFDYAELPDLHATALEMPYAGTQISMLIILPNQVNGLSQLERQLARSEYDLNAIAAQLRRETVTVRIPRFRIEFEQDMTEPLQSLGVKEMFTSNSQVDAMLDKRAMVSKIQQKAFIDVNEAGSEASASSYAKFVPLSLPVKSHEFTADHPFIFAIRSPEAVLFIGHVVQPTQVA
ncbi:antichymotrypsin-2 [Drosophila tropicalis]|uniref:antichymotrypsin-2 n=1 Tax=Drosophila tropicalis TaxID=46794 RepID=UPI0035AB979B